ncbi:MAG: hypothetical protein PSV23_14015 [Brevundimonas sp.]|uniref:hypothetical protein n=1 Tax=Brevundimonas sp. TaxID=1871086 RepID=UPI002488C013|nr:hypothetical protein [Brevundimonas sp.]MDI1327901.1 hypothetical protein [Brevundimonas sp.]
MTQATPILRQPHCRRGAAEWDEIRRLYQAGATAKALVRAYGGTERTLYTHAREAGWLRKDDRTPPATGLTPVEADAAVRALGAEDGVPGPDAACRALAADASLGEAARAAATTAIALLRDGQAAGAYAHARLAGTLERLARGAVGDGGGDATEPGRVAALDFLRREAVRDYPSTPSGSARPVGSADRSSTPSLRDREETGG